MIYVIYVIVSLVNCIFFSIIFKARLLIPSTYIYYIWMQNNLDILNQCYIHHLYKRFKVYKLYNMLHSTSLVREDKFWVYRILNLPWYSLLKSQFSFSRKTYYYRNTSTSCFYVNYTITLIPIPRFDLLFIVNHTITLIPIPRFDLLFLRKSHDYLNPYPEIRPLVFT